MPVVDVHAHAIVWDHVLLGSDYPFDMAATDPVGAVEMAGLEEADRRRVLEFNADSFLRPLGKN